MIPAMPNKPDPSNPARTSPFQSWRQCRGVADPERSAAPSIMSVFRHTQHRGSRVADETDAARWSHGPQLAQFRGPLIKSALCVGEVGACPQVRSRHGSRPFEGGLTMVAYRRLQTAMLSCPSRPPNHRVETNRRPATLSRSWQVIGGFFCVYDAALSAAVAHPGR